MKESFYIYGVNSVEESLKENVKKVEKLYIKNNYSNANLVFIKNICTQNKIPVNFVDVKKIDDLVGNVTHQGIAALMRDFDYVEIDNFIKDMQDDKKYLFVLLDDIEDTHNMGAIIRSSAAAGASAIIIPKHGGAPINGVVYKTSAGAVNKIPIIRVSNLANAVEKLKEKHVWFMALDGESDKSIWQEDLKCSVGIVVGNEGSGVHKKIMESCDFRVCIPMKNGVESLNASVAAAVSAFEWRRQNWE